VKNTDMGKDRVENRLPVLVSDESAADSGNRTWFPVDLSKFRALSVDLEQPDDLTVGYTVTGGYLQKR